ncbi:antibiotic biosynthesis monooxygenase [Kitasatospora acidiphila]|uniref:Antibiotic biosynthesis monooxygenase n=1 Tax=Kitasatospora acidiphila TaxID=2567942 RepID=A0A540W0V0_9ACTN|nr:putative quinol monooxygenase [Kitasatospora acidiphila]TQF02636.1 antibiotic biosynthesis monooxygenase [Kitasatospora acidiphila]
MIFIVVKFPVKPEYADSWLSHVDAFTKATRAEPGNLWFEWSRSVEEPDTYVLVEAFQDDAGEAHVNSDHFRAAMGTMRPLVQRAPQIVSTTIEGANGWSKLGELGLD